MKTRADLYENLRKIKEKEEMHAKLVEEFYQELCDQNPEWEIRKREVLEVSHRPSKHHFQQRSHQIAIVAQRDARKGSVIHPILHPLVAISFFMVVSLFPYAGILSISDSLLYCTTPCSYSYPFL